MVNREFSRRRWLKLAAVGGGVATLAGCSDSDPSEAPADRPQSDADGAASIPALRLETAGFASARQFENGNYERIHASRKRRAIETLLADPEVNDLVTDWIGSFEAYEVLTNHLETISIQGPTSLRIDEQGFPDGDEAEFEVTAENRRTVYGLVDRYRDELVALEITEPQDVTWTVTQNPAQMEIGQLIHRTETVQDAFGDMTDREWYPSWKGAAGGYAGIGQADLRHGEGSTAVMHVKDDGDLRVISALIDGSEPGNPDLVDVAVVDHAVEYPLYRLAETIEPRSESMLAALPDVPTEQRPYYTANDGYHRIEPPAESFEQDGWTIEWEQSAVHGATVSAAYNDSPVFEAMDSPITYTGYYLPPREGRNTREWYFPDDDTVFSGDLLFWDVHSSVTGGPGLLGKLDFPAREGVPNGFQLKSHYHSSAIGRESIDFHSGVRFGPYNYDIAYEFYEDGVLTPVFRRAGPGFMTHFMQKLEENADSYGENGTYEEPVVPHYISTQAIDITPGTEDGTAVELFDGDEWTTPESEFYLEGEPGTIARFSNPDGTETVDVPLDETLELVVVRRDSDEIGPGEYPAHRLYDEDAVSELYHPAQYVDEQPIQGERLIVWLLMLGSTNQLPYPAGVTNFVTTARLTLSGY
ncbi:hypothetical protein CHINAEXTREME_16790 [Halobiforma lacisalsi AJ5]|uniref:Uncharacterized protein n=1 Tax=Natronobacterium lacisalsi AJ5 TaxID=358396 RepID=M0LQ55_NATLA|nr:twin-arginine translocation signal domain-containing protein [Halobiforma lacisalsi]APW99327.1 hypothetical protein CHINAEXTREME_16790 [Halobiforma lacisalsi AJ5]EMA35243.1 hypothetical protein C445_05973 [Halobiforma lacisalsi AJ5]